MGFFSHITTDTGRSVPNMASGLKPLPVVMMDDKNNMYFEDAYEGYGIYEGKDIFEFTAEMNQELTDKMIEDNFNIEIYKAKGLRNTGFIQYYYPELIKRLYHIKIKYPNIIEWKDGTPIPDWKDVKLKDCPNQGYAK